MIGQRSRFNSDQLVNFLKTGNKQNVSLTQLSDERDHVQQKHLKSTPFLGQPLYSLPVTSCDQISKGTHILFRQGNAFPPMYCSALIQQITYDEQGIVSLEVITNTLKEGIITYTVDFTQLKSLSKVVYLSSRFSEEEAIIRAQGLKRNNKNCYHQEYYNSHHFVTMCLSGCEYSLADIVTKKQVSDYEGKLLYDDTFSGHYEVVTLFYSCLQVIIFMIIKKS